MPAHPDAPPAPVVPAWSWQLVPALLVCLAAPAFFVVRVPWLGWLLLAAGLAAALLIERTLSATRPQGGAGAPQDSEWACRVR